VIVHGWGGDSRGNWFPWLADALRENKFEVSVPDFPNSEFPDLSAWLHYFKNNVVINSETILVGHSLGVPFILRFLEEYSKSVILGRSSNDDSRIDSGQKARMTRAAFLVAAFDKPLGIAEIQNFVDKPFNFAKIKSSCESFTIINSDNDPYFPLSIGKKLAKNLNAKLVIEKDGGHLQNPSGVFSYPKLLNEILESQGSPE